MTAGPSTGPVGPPPPAAGPESAPGLPPPAERGRTALSDRAVAKIASRAAREALEGRFGAPPERLGLHAPRASATVFDGSARVTLTIDLPYPADIARTVEDLRGRIGGRLAALTGLAVDELGLTVRRLVLSGGPGRGRVR